MSYTPNASQLTEPVESRAVQTAALEFRTVKAKLTRALRYQITDAVGSQAELPLAGARAGRLLVFDPTTAQPTPGPLTADVARIAADASLGANSAASALNSASSALNSALMAAGHRPPQPLQFVSVFVFMTPSQIAAVEAGTSTEDLSMAFEQAIMTGKRVYVPKGRYRVNVTINHKTIIVGDGSLSTILEPFNENVAIMTYTLSAQVTPVPSYWDYHSEVNGIGFQGRTARTGVGFTFSTTHQENYTNNMEFANNVKFYACRFFNLDKGAQFPFGNIGTEFYSCGFTGNRYGVYTLNNKRSLGTANIMHTGNKYFFAGEFNGNTVGIYIHNDADGFGAISLYGTIIQGNSIGIYAFIAPTVLVPMLLSTVWFEANGEGLGGGTSTIDNWTGSVRSLQTLNNKNIIIDGTDVVMNIHSGLVGDIWLRATHSVVRCTDCRVESQVGFGGGTIVVDAPDTSSVLLVNPTTVGGWSSGVYIPQVEGQASVKFRNLTNGSGAAIGRVFNTSARTVSNVAYGESLVSSMPLTAPAILGLGNVDLFGTLVSDGNIFPTCNEFTRADFLSSQFTRLIAPDSLVTTVQGWYVFTVDIKIMSGPGVTCFIGDRDTAQLAVFRCTNVGTWNTFAAMGLAVAGQTLYLDFSGLNGDTTWRVSAYQLHRFSTERQAQNFLASKAFAVRVATDTVPSGLNLFLPVVGDVFTITGPETISTISTLGQAGRRVTLVFAGALTVLSTGNIRLASDFVTTANDCLTLVCDGANWFEVSRSVN